MNDIGNIVIGFIAYVYTLYMLADVASDFINKKCSWFKFSCVFITFIFVINKFWEVIN